MAVTINPHTTRATGTILTAAIYNGDHVNHVNNANALNAGKADLPITGGSISNNTITNANLADMAAWSIKMRNNAAAGAPQDAIFSAVTTKAPVSGDFAVGWDATGAIKKYDVVAFGGAAASMPRRTISSGDTIVAGDKGGIVEATSGSFTLAFTAAATLASGFWCIISNTGTGDVALDPNGAELIDGLTTWTLYPGGAILIQCSGTAFESVLLTPMIKIFDSSATFVKPGCGSIARVACIGGGGGGGRANASGNGSGGGGGGSNEAVLSLSVIGATESVTIGAGGAAAAANATNGTIGGATTFGSFVTGQPGGGGGFAALNAASFAGTGGGTTIPGITASPNFATSSVSNFFWFVLSNVFISTSLGVGGMGARADNSPCGGFNCAAASAIRGGGGGGGKALAVVIAAGSSQGGGAGGASGVNGSVPGGGGGGNVNAAAGAGASGRCIVEIS